jgi:hypothetical protein
LVAISTLQLVLFGGEMRELDEQDKRIEKILGQFDTDVNEKSSASTKDQAGRSFFVNDCECMYSNIVLQPFQAIRPAGEAEREVARKKVVLWQKDR